MAKNDDIIKKIRAGNFKENNGHVIRTINILRDKPVKLKDIKYALTKIAECDIVDSVNFLQEEGYIRLRHIESKIETTLADAEFEQLEAKVSGKGIRLLNGSIKDDVVDV